MTKIDQILAHYNESHKSKPLQIEHLVKYLKLLHEYVNHPVFGMYDNNLGTCFYMQGRIDGRTPFGIWYSLSKYLPVAQEWQARRVTGVEPGRTPERLEMVDKLYWQLAKELVRHGVNIPFLPKRKGETDESGNRKEGRVSTGEDHLDVGDTEGSQRDVRTGQSVGVSCPSGERESGSIAELEGGHTGPTAGASVLRAAAQPCSVVSDTLKQARSDWHATIHGDGGNCPVCERWGKVYSRNINRTMARSLQWLYDAQQKASDLRTWIDVPNTAPKHVLRTNQLATLRWWGLIERKPEDLEDKTQKHTGLWRITLRGMDFVEGKIRVPKTVKTYNAEPVGYGKELVSFTDVHEIEFDYDAVMETNSEELKDKLFGAVTA